MKKILGTLIVLVALYFGVSIGMYVALPPTVRAQVNTFCAANLACTVTANWNFSGTTAFSGSSTHTGTETFANINNVIFADQQAGADACAKITAAEALLPTANGGVVDARGFQGTQAVCAGGFAVGSTTKPVQLLLGASVIQVQAQVTVAIGSEIDGISANNGANVSSAIKAAGTFAGGALIQFQNSGNSGAVQLSDLQVQCANIAGCTGVDLGVSQDLTRLHRVLIYNWVTSCVIATNAQVQQVKLDSVFCLGGPSTTGTSVGIDLGSGGGLNDNFDLTDVGVTTTSATPMLADIRCNSCNLHGDTIHMENATDGVLLTGGNNGAAFLDTVSGLSNLTNVVHVAASWTGSAAIHGVRKFSSTRAVLNDLGLPSCSDESLGSYEFSSSASSPLQFVSTCSTGKSQLTSPVLNGTPSGTGITTLTLKTGSGGGNYTGANTTFAAVDTTNLCYSVTVPTGWKLSVQASGVLESVTAAVVQSVALADAGATCTTGGVTALAGSERDITPAAIATFDASFATAYVLTGDGSAHSIVLLAKTANGSDDWGVQNTSAAAAPSMTFYARCRATNYVYTT